MVNKKDEIIKHLTDGLKVEEVVQMTGASERYVYQVQEGLKKIEKGTTPGLMTLGEDLLNLGKFFGIEKKEVGHMLLKSALTGKGGIGDLFQEHKSSRSKIEKYVDGVKSLIPYVWGSILLFYLLKWVGVWIA